MVKRLAAWGEDRSTPASLPPLRGVICKLFPKERYGFILKEGGGEVYFHANALQGLTFKQLEDGTEVVFGLEQRDKGLQATVVTLPPPIAKVL